MASNISDASSPDSFAPMSGNPVRPSGSASSSSGAAASSVSTVSPALATSFAIAVMAGVFVSIQGIFNGAFTASAGPLLAGWVSYLGTLITVVVIIVAQGNAAKFMRILREHGKLWWFEWEPVVWPSSSPWLGESRWLVPRSPLCVRSLVKQSWGWCLTVLV